MNKYIIELLKTESTVIIPDFGALMGTGKSLMFNSILKFNDGKLQKYIAEKEGRDEQEVLNMIAGHVRDIQLDLGKGNTYQIFGLGSFRKNDSGKIVFTAEGDTPVADEIPKEEPVASPIISLDKEKIEEVVEEKIEQPVEEKEIDKKTAVIPVVENKVEDVKEGVVKEKIEEKEKKVVPPVLAKSEKGKPKKEKPKKEKKKKKKGWIVWLIILLLLAGGGTFVALKWKEVNHWISSFTTGDKQEVVDQYLTTNNGGEDLNDLIESADALVDSLGNTVNQEDSIETEEGGQALTSKETEETTEEEYEQNEMVEEPKQEEVIVNEPVEVSSELKYHVLIGAFGNKANAEGLVQKLKEAGFSNARILPGSGLNKVVAGSWATRSEAKDNLAKAQAFKDGAYVIKK